MAGNRLRSCLWCGRLPSTHTATDCKKNSQMKDAFYIKRLYSDIKSAYLKILWPAQQEVSWLMKKKSNAFKLLKEGKKLCVASGVWILKHYSRKSPTQGFTSLLYQDVLATLWASGMSPLPAHESGQGPTGTSCASHLPAQPQAHLLRHGCTDREPDFHS